MLGRTMSIKVVATPKESWPPYVLYQQKNSRLYCLYTKTESVSYACREYKGSKQRDCLVSYHIEMQPSNCQEIIRDDIRDKAH